MSYLYQFNIKDYHAIKSANIVIDGITVLSGLNGSGKSTISRWLHYALKVLNDYEKLVEVECINEFYEFLLDLRRFSTSFDEVSRSRKLSEIIDAFRSSDIKNLSDTSSHFDEALKAIEDSLSVNFKSFPSSFNIERLNQLFNAGIAPYDSEDVAIYKIRNQIISDYLSILRKSDEKKADRSLRNFVDKILAKTDTDIDSGEISLELMENGVHLIGDDVFKIPMDIRNSIYIDTVKIGQHFNSFRPDPLIKMCIKQNPSPSKKSDVIARLIKRVIGGDVEINKNSKGFITKSRSLEFVAKDGSTFNLKGAATGIISFSYLLQLIKNGWINENTMLIIDEPECHLHPQWIVDYAKILVLLHKLVGTRILISSHNPDMVAAIQSIAEYYKVIDNTHFYIAEKEDVNSHKYIFKDLGTSIAEIFDSFNIAIDRIAKYTPKEYIDIDAALSPSSSGQQ